MWEDFVLPQSGLHIWKLHCIKSLEGWWGLMRSAQADSSRDQDSQGPSLLHAFLKDKQGEWGIHLSLRNSLHFYQDWELLCHKNKEQVNAVFTKIQLDDPSKREMGKAHVAQVSLLRTGMSVLASPSGPTRRFCKLLLSFIFLPLRGVFFCPPPPEKPSNLKQR